ncbi:MAG: DUF1499 domain-containing protein [Hyphomonas sp.]|uniref:DUF1499 domain-containing protein n=1 Tax=Hyphomonas sp. TaxID=87 RepID=UPI003526EC66
MMRPLSALAALTMMAACTSSPVPPDEWVDFSGLAPVAAGNQYLLCGPAVCPAAGEPGEALRFSFPADHVASVVAGLEPSAVQRQLDNGDYQLKYVAVTPIARFRDDVDVLVHADSEYTAEIAIYSRSRVGKSDFGKNKSRVDALVESLKAELGEPLKPD